MWDSFVNQDMEPRTNLLTALGSIDDSWVQRRKRTQRRNIHHYIHRPQALLYAHQQVPLWYHGVGVHAVSRSVTGICQKLKR